MTEVQRCLAHWDKYLGPRGGGGSPFGINDTLWDVVDDFREAIEVDGMSYHGAYMSIVACIDEVENRVRLLVRDPNTKVTAVTEAFRDALADVGAIALREVYRNAEGGKT